MRCGRRTGSIRSSRATPQENRARVIGSLVDYLFAPEEREAVIEKMASAECRIVSLTITEGGYYVREGTGGFDEAHPDIVRDLAHPHEPASTFGYLAEALDRRAPARPRAVHGTVLRQPAAQRRRDASGDAGLRRAPGSRPGRLDRGERRLPQQHGRPHHARHDGRPPGDGPARVRRRRCLAGDHRALPPVDPGGPFSGGPAALGARRGAVHRRCRALREDEDPPAQRQPPGDDLHRHPARVHVDRRGHGRSGHPEARPRERWTSR